MTNCPTYNFSRKFLLHVIGCLICMYVCIRVGHKAGPCTAIFRCLIYISSLACLLFCCQEREALKRRTLFLVRSIYPVKISDIFCSSCYRILRPKYPEKVKIMVITFLDMAPCSLIHRSRFWDEPAASLFKAVDVGLKASCSLCG
jgi:hypothetical protein